MNSMTGYGYREIVEGQMQLSVEIKSVNSRYLDLNINMPSYLNFLESKIKKIINGVACRGLITVNIKVHNAQNNPKINVNKELFDSYKNAFQNLCTVESQFELTKYIMSQPGVIDTSFSYDSQEYEKLILPLVSSVAEIFASDRKREGQNLYIDLSKKLDVLKNCADFFKEWQPKMENIFKEQITRKFKELIQDYADERRIMEETAALLVKYTINEEIVRLQSHLEALKNEFQNNPSPGKKIDFICQEINREVNTIGSKNQFPEVGAIVVNAKDALENIREQARNVE